MKFNQVTLSGVMSLVSLAAAVTINMPAQAQYPPCPATYEQVQAAIREAARRDGLYSASQLRSFPSKSLGLVEQLKALYINPSCTNLRARIQPSFQLFWKRAIQAKYEYKIMFLELDLAKIGLTSEQRRSIRQKITDLRDEMVQEINATVGSFFDRY